MSRNDIPFGERTSHLYSAFFDDAPVGLHLQAKDGTVLRANRALLLLLGYTEAEFVGRKIAEFHVDGQAADVVVNRLADGGTLSSHEVALRAKDGSMRWALLSANAFTEGGQFVHARCFTRDVTQLKEAQLALAEADRRKSAILNASLDAIITMDAEGRLVDFNNAAERIFGYRRHVAVGRLLADLIIPPSFREAHARGLRRYLDTGVGRVIGRRIEISALHADGHEFPVELSIAAVEGPKPLFTATLRDITQRKAGEAALLEADRRKDEFIAALSHELRNPLGPMRNAATLLSMAGLSKERQAWAIDVLSRQIRHMASLLDDLLDVARISHGKLVLRRQLVDLADVVQSAVEVARPLLDEKNQKLELLLPPSRLELVADPVRLSQILSNLLINASKYSEPGTLVVLGASHSAGCIRVEVRDQGIGLAPDDIAQLFTMFKQLPGRHAGPASGLGVGLALSKVLVEMHGGTLEVRSMGPGSGSTFAVMLPAVGAGSF